MSCYQCAKELHKTSQQFGCPRCKFITCKKCLSYTLPGADNNTPKVCLQCYDRTIGKVPDVDARSLEPPKNYLRRMEALNSGSVTQSKQKTHRHETDQLANRLNALQAADTSNLPSDDEIRARLDALSNFILTRETKDPAGPSACETKTDEVQSILNKATDEVRLSLMHEGGSGTTPDSVYCSFCDNLATVICPACMDEEFCGHCFTKAHRSRHMRNHVSAPIINDRKKPGTNTLK